MLAAESLPPSAGSRGREAAPGHSLRASSRAGSHLVVPLVIAGHLLLTVPLSFALGARRASVQPQRMASKTGLQEGGPATQIVVNPTGRFERYEVPNAD